MFSWLAKKASNIFGKTKKKIQSSFARVFSLSDKSVYEKVFEMMLDADFGFEISKNAATHISRLILQNAQENHNEKEFILDEICRYLRRILDSVEHNFKYCEQHKLNVIYLAGINGAGKTSFAGKIANFFVASGKKSLIICADKFRFAAEEQLNIVSSQAGAFFFNDQKCKSPHSAIYQGISYAILHGYRLAIVDLSGRLDTNEPLLHELAALVKIADKFESVKKRTFVVLDAASGIVSVKQCKKFTDYISIDKIIVSKIDSSSKGGSIFAAIQECKIGIAYISTGEAIEDVSGFDQDEFLEGIF